MEFCVYFVIISRLWNGTFKKYIHNSRLLERGFEVSFHSKILLVTIYNKRMLDIKSLRIFFACIRNAGNDYL